MNTDAQTEVRRPFLDRPGTAFTWALGLIVFSMVLGFFYQDSSCLKVAVLSFLFCLPAFLIFAFTDYYGSLDRVIFVETLKKPHWLMNVKINTLYLVGWFPLFYGLTYFAVTGLVWSLPQRFIGERIWAALFYLVLFPVLLLRLPINVFFRKTSLHLVVLFLLPFLLKSIFYPCAHIQCWVKLLLYAGLSNAGFYLFLKLSLRILRHHIILTNWSDKRFTQRFNQFFIQLLPE